MNLKLLQGLKKIVWKFDGDLTVSLKVISEKQCYAVMKYIVVYYFFSLIFFLLNIHICFVLYIYFFYCIISHLMYKYIYISYIDIFLLFSALKMVYGDRNFNK